MMRYLTRTFLAVLLIAGLSGCSDFLSPSTQQSKTPGQGIQDADDLAGLVRGAYDRMHQVSYYGRDFVIYGSVRTDNAYSTGNSGRFVAPSDYTMNWTSGFASGTWEAIYEVIASANR